MQLQRRQKADKNVKDAEVRIIAATGGMIRKLVLIVGILGALTAAEGLNRFGGLVAAIGGADGPFYMGTLAV